MVLLVLAGIWVVVIAVPLVRAKTEGKLGDSIGSFRRHLSVLERAAPLTWCRPTGCTCLPMPPAPSAPTAPPWRPKAGCPPAGDAAPRRRNAAVTS